MSHRTVADRSLDLAVVGVLLGVRRRTLCVALAGWPGSFAALAHGTRLGTIVVDHPYATPTPPGATTGAAYLRNVGNRGDVADRLVAARTPVAAGVEFHRKTPGGEIVVPAIDLAPRSTQKIRHDGPLRMVLVGLREPLRDGETFKMTLSFEHAGQVEVKVWVQTPRARDERRN